MFHCGNAFFVFQHCRPEQVYGESFILEYMNLNVIVNLLYWWLS